jgi:peptidoglycan/xylan/chitin deacetylase (PgdA/CDA1 family)
MCAKNYPAAVREIAAQGHELGSHGFDHVPVHRQTREDFRRDVEASIELVESLAGRRPVGYRAPAFSITRGSAWAFELLSDLGFTYDSSQYDTPRLPNRLLGIPDEPYRLEVRPGKELIEFPIAVGRWRGKRIPSAGAPTGGSCRSASSSGRSAERLRRRPRQYSISTPMSSIRSHSEPPAGPVLGPPPTSSTGTRGAAGSPGSSARRPRNSSS